MKKKLLALLIIVLCFSFMPKIKALRCYYKGFESYSISRSADEDTDLKNCPKEGEEGSDVCFPTKKGFEAEFVIPSETSDETEYAHANVLYDLWKDYEDKTLVQKGTVAFIDNWSEYSNYYVSDGGHCPSYMSYFGPCFKNELPELPEDGIDSYFHFGLFNAKIYPNEQSISTIVSDYVQVSSLFGSCMFFAKFDHDSDDDGVEVTKNVSCNDFDSETGPNGNDGCTTNPDFSCLWVKKGDVTYCNFDDLTYTRCGDSWDIPDKFPPLTSFLVNFIKIVTPLILVFVSVISLLKAVSSQKDDELKKIKSSFIRRVIAAVIVFFIIQITQFVILKVADNSERDSMTTCFSCLLNNDCSKNRYYKTMIGNDYYCTYLNDKDNYYNCKTGKLIGSKEKITENIDNNKSNSSSNSTTTTNSGNSNSSSTRTSSDENKHTGVGRDT